MSALVLRLHLHVKLVSSKVLHTQVVQTNEASAYFSLYLLNALTKSNNFGTLTQQFILNIVLNDIYSCALEGASSIKQLARCFLTSSFIQPL